MCDESASRPLIKHSTIEITNKRISIESIDKKIKLHSTVQRESLRKQILNAVECVDVSLGSGVWNLLAFVALRGLKKETQTPF